jgi:hypothetical protein
MLATVNREVALRELEIEHNAVRALIEELTQAEMTRPDTIRYGLYADQELSFQDLLAHLITYEMFSVEAIDSWKHGEKHWSVEAMQSPAGSKRIHYAGIEDRREMSLDAVLDQWEDTQAALMEAIRGLTDDEWRGAALYPAAVPTDLGGILEVILVAPPRPVYRHLPVHIPDERAYVRSLRSG